MEQPSPSSEKNIIAQFRSSEGEVTGNQLDLPLNTTAGQLEILINHLLNNVSSSLLLLLLLQLS